MTLRQARWLKILAAGAVGSLLVVNLIAYQQAGAMMNFSRAGRRTERPENLGFLDKAKVLLCGVDLPRPRSDLPPSVLGPACRSVILPGTNGIRLGSWYCPSATNGPLVILFHGYGGEKTGVLPVAEAFQEMGCSVLLVDFRGSGDSSESYTTIGFLEAEDVICAIRYAQASLPDSGLVLYGHSMGAAAVLRAADSLGARPDAIIVESVFDNLLHTVERRFEAMKMPCFPAARLLVFWGGVRGGFNGFELAPERYAKGVDCPALFLHGAFDPRARLEDARRVFDAVPSARSGHLKRFKEFSASGHASGLAQSPGEWKETVDRFLTAAFRRQPGL